ncbi:MAG: hypothetical protein JXQ75_03830 [Phycisphaerae bacterium]|nr:hypothetical protein [Phycisphaerae bacterium]
MALRVKCKCGRSLKISSKLAGKKLTCPGCGRPFRIPAERFKATAVAAKRRPAKPPTPASLATPAPAELDLQPANLDLDVPPLAADFNAPGGAEHSTSDIFGGSDHLVVDEGAPLPAAPVTAIVAETVGYAHDPSKRRSYGGNVTDDVIQGPKRGFWADAFLSFVYPVLSVGNATNFAGTAIIALIITVIPVGIAIMPCLFIAPGLTAMLILCGYVWGAYLSALRATASGTADMPGIKFADGVYEDAIKPFFKYLGAYAVAFAPVVALAIGFACNWLPPSLSWLLLIWILAGLFFVPMSLVLFALDAMGMLARLDLIFLTIIRTFLPYLSIWLMFILVGLASFIPLAGYILMNLGIQATLPEIPEVGLIGTLLFEVLDVYVTLVAMRIIGLYYLHFKKRFAIVME